MNIGKRFEDLRDDLNELFETFDRNQAHSTGALYQEGKTLDEGIFNVWRGQLDEGQKKALDAARKEFHRDGGSNGEFLDSVRAWAQPTL